MNNEKYAAMKDKINFLIALLKHTTKRIKDTEAYNSMYLNLLVVPLLSVFFSINISKKRFLYNNTHSPPVHSYL